MAALHVGAFVFIAVTLLGGCFSVTDEEFQVGFIANITLIHKCFDFNYCKFKFYPTICWLILEHRSNSGKHYQTVDRGSRGVKRKT